MRSLVRGSRVLPSKGMARLLATGGVLILLALLLTACGGEEPTVAPTATSPQPVATVQATAAPGDTTRPTPTTGAAAGANFEQEWQKLIADAKAEGEFVAVLGGSASRNYRPVYEHFAEKFGINLVFSGGSGTAAANRILAERNAGKYTVDLLSTGGTTTNVRLVPAGALQPIRPLLIHPEILDESKWYQGHLWFTDEEQKYGMIFSGAVSPIAVDARYNTNLVSTEEVDALGSAFDYFQDKWKGKIVSIPPIVQGAGGTYYQAYVSPELGKEFLRKFMVDMKPFWTEDYRLIADGVARGKFHWGMFIGSGGRDLDALADQGLPVGRVADRVAETGKQWKESGDISASGSGNTFGVADRPPHPNVIKLFTNWFLSKEGQTIMHTMSASTPDQSLRTDVTDMGKTDPNERRKPGVNYNIPDADPELLKQFEESILYARELYRESIGR